MSKFDRKLTNAVLSKAMKSYVEFKDHPKVGNKEIIGIVDYTIHSKYRRFYIVDIKTGKVLRQHHVAHGSKSSHRRDAGKAVDFSNVVGSRKSSKGPIVTGRVYYGKYGRSLKLHGLVVGLNHNIFKRFIVLHKSKYVTDKFINNYGRVGQSWGCLSVDPAIVDSLIDQIKDGVFIYLHA